jgi:hypothetical protein
VKASDDPFQNSTQRPFFDQSRGQTNNSWTETMGNLSADYAKNSEPFVPTIAPALKQRFSNDYGYLQATEGKQESSGE